MQNLIRPQHMHEGAVFNLTGNIDSHFRYQRKQLSRKLRSLMLTNCSKLPMGLNICHWPFSCLEG